jgi:desampylase
MEITREVYAKLVSYGNSSPVEVCGALLGKKNGGSWACDEFVPMTNVSTLDKGSHYVPDPNEFFQVIKRTTHMTSDAEKDLVGIFHTHPNNRATPSITDVMGAGYEGIYIIHSPKYLEVKAYYYNGTDREFFPEKLIEA